jgi:molecular chaperone DnaJ
MKDPYQVLGVAKTASDDEIKKAFRKAAREHHPDANPDRREEAEKKMAELNQAYALLSDPQKRAQFDRYGAAGGGAGGFDFGAGGGVNLGDLFDIFTTVAGSQGGRAREAIRRGSDVRYDLVLTLEECWSGVSKDLNIPTLLECETCDGNGAAPGTQSENCQACSGTGRQREVRNTFFGQFVQEALCARCGGKGKIIPTPCPTCRGEGRARGTRTLNVQIPAGVDDGDRVRVTGGGEDGAAGAPAGDLYCFVTVEEHAQFERAERDVLLGVPLSFSQAALGDTIEVPTLEMAEEGGPVRATIVVPEGTQANTLFRLSGKGFPDRYGRRGDQICVAQVVVPRTLNDRQRELLRELAEENDEHPEEQPRGFFSKLKDAILGD